MKKKASILLILILAVVAVFSAACGPNPNIAAKLGIVETAAPDNMIEFAEWDIFSEYAQNQIKPHWDHENAEFVCTAEQGYYCDQAVPPLGIDLYFRTKTIKSGERVAYRHGWLKKFVDYVKITIKEEGHIVGYALVRVNKEKKILDYIPEVVKAGLFPKVEGEYQEITQEQMDIIFENYKK